jgi:CelD/BcsL family acetyltransferase involved in cellulose biosynthesis
MSAPRLVELNSASEIRSVATEWDDLWRRSEVAIPIARAELVAHWIEHSGPAAVRAFAVEQDGRFVAALPLVGGRLKRFIPICRLPYNNWSWAGDLLLDPAADLAEALNTLLAGLSQLGWPLIWFDAIPIEAPRWRQFAAAANAHGLRTQTRESFRVAEVAIDHDWPDYMLRWSKSHRRQMKRMESRADAAGGAVLTTHCGLRPDEVEPLLRRGFTIEDSGWKGAAGTSVLKAPGRFAFHLEEAREIAKIGALQLSFLEIQGRPIAFEYGWNCKGVHCAFKIGYDESFAELTPGQLLRHRLLHRYFADPRQRMLDFLGPLTGATAKWATATYPVGRLVLSTGSLSGRIVLHAYRSWWPTLQRLRRQFSGSRDVDPVNPA